MRLELSWKKSRKKRPIVYTTPKYIAITLEVELPELLLSLLIVIGETFSVTMCTEIPSSESVAESVVKRQYGRSICFCVPSYPNSVNVALCGVPMFVGCLFESKCTRLATPGTSMGTCP
eukprot:CAMPEP_0115362064 /NCGR_PEP_ID=MMETSP0270-20121206/102518_1 /TAXON_ID=71861 /ORGANISM="Scrippsiella trochoidea, Strain CCMP3099" /LENGTH=118 /DNA_ID=CAMNT_0002784635 /DNA_START=185 /DNA_END=538 /DNA_ORIENTATION=+